MPGEAITVTAIPAGSGVTSVHIPPEFREDTEESRRYYAKSADELIFYADTKNYRGRGCILTIVPDSERPPLLTNDERQAADEDVILLLADCGS